MAKSSHRPRRAAPARWRVPMVLGVALSVSLAPAHLLARGADEHAAAPISPLPPAVVVDNVGVLDPTVAATGAFTGRGVAIDGDLALVGAPGNPGAVAGEVYAYRRDPGTGEWMRLPQILANPGTQQNFGAAIAMLGGVAVIGAPGFGSAAGAAYRYTFDATMGRWTGAALVAPTMASPRQLFGSSVAISERWIAVGAPDTGSTAARFGAVAVYAADGTGGEWVLSPLTSGGEDDRFGASVAVSGDTLLVGAPFGDGAVMDQGLVHTFDHGGGAWTALPDDLRDAPVAMARFGESVALSESGTRALVGARGAGTGGAAFVYTRASAAGTAWGVATMLAPAGTVASDRVGVSVALSGTDALVGASGGENAGDPMDVGLAYLFALRDPGPAYVEIATFRFVGGRANDQLGTTVAMSGTTVLASAPGVLTSDSYVGVFTVPFANGVECTAASQCESGVCATVGAVGVCCESACGGMCEACTASGDCAPANEGGACTAAGACGAGTCTAGACDTPGCDAGPGDAGPGDGGGVTMDAGGPPTRPRIRISGCRCGVGPASASPGGAALLVLLGLAVVARRRRRSVGARARLASVALLLSLASITVPVSAQDGAEAPDATDALLVEALREYDTGNYEEAYALFLRVHEVRPSARTERALGNAAFELRRYRQAVEWLELAIDDTRTPLTEGMRAEVEGVLRRARAFIGHFAISTNVEGATILVDGQPEATRDLDLDLGEHEITATAEGYEPASRTVSVHGGEDESIELVLVRSERGGTTVILPREDPGGVYRDLGWAAVVAGGALALGGAVSAAIWGDTVGTLNANLAIGACYADPITENVLPDAGDPTSIATCIDQENRYRLALPFAYVGLIGGGVLLATGLGLVLGAPSAAADGEAPAVSVACGPFAEGGVTCSGRF